MEAYFFCESFVSKPNFYYMSFTNRKFSSSESKITHDQIALTKAMIICCNSVNVTSNSTLMTQEMHKAQKDKN